MRHSVLLASAALLLAAGATPAAAQSTPQPGDRVRIVAPAYGVTSPTAGTVRGFEGDTLVLAMGGRGSGDFGGVEMRLPATAIMRLETSRGTRSRIGTGALGVAGGTVLGFAASRAHRRFSTNCGSRCGMTGPGVGEYDDSRTPKIIAAGSVIGLAVGVLLPGERWEASRGIRISAPAEGTGASVGLSLRF